MKRTNLRRFLLAFMVQVIVAGSVSGSIFASTAAEFESFAAAGALAQSVSAQSAEGPAAAPAIPVNLNATVENGTVTLAWNTVDGADSYSVYQGGSMDSYDAVPIISGITGTSCKIANLPKGAVYYFAVTAVKASVESDKSYPVSVSMAEAGPLGEQNLSAPVVTGYNVSTNHGGEAVNGTDDQYILLDVRYDRPVTVESAEAVLSELSFTFNGIVSKKLTLGSDGKSLHMELHFSFAGVSNRLIVQSLADGGKTLTTVKGAGGENANFPKVNLLVPTGTKLDTISQTVGSATATAAVYEKLTVLPSATRGMVHFLFLKNGEPVDKVNTYGASFAAHLHTYLTLTSTDFAKNVASAFNGLSGEFDNYTASADGDTLLIQANRPEAGEVIDLRVFAYPQDRNTWADKSGLNASIAAAVSQDLPPSLDTDELKDEVWKARSVQASVYYLQPEVDLQTVKLNTLMSYTVGFEENGGSPVEDRTLLYNGNVLDQAPHTVRAGYTLAGWYTDAELTKPAVFPLTVTGDRTLYAKWTALNAPDGLMASSGDGKVTLNWTAAEGAEKYSVYAGTVPGDYTLPAASVTSATYTFDGLANGTLYYFAVTAWRDGQESVKSGEVSATPVAAYAPGGVSSGDSGTRSGASGPDASGASDSQTVDGGAIVAEAIVDASGKASATVSAESIAKTLALAGREKGSDLVIRIDASGASVVETTLPKASVAAIVESGAGALTLKTPLVTVSLDAAALSAIVRNAGENISISVGKPLPSSLSEPLRAAVGNRPVYEFSVHSDGRMIDSFQGGRAKVSVGYSPAAGETSGQIVVNYISADGRASTVAQSAYNAATGEVSFLTGHFSLYSIGYSDVSWSDVSGWYMDYAVFLGARKIVNGTETGKFSPNREVTRAELAQMLAKLSGDDLGAYTASSFADVKSDAWYLPAVQWAAEHGIVKGYGGRFNPAAPVSRQDLAVMLARFAEPANSQLTGGSPVSGFSDEARIADYAKASVAAMRQAGIVSGRAAGQFDPEGHATRAEASKMVALLLQQLL